MQKITNLATPENMTDDEFIQYAPRGVNYWLDDAIERVSTLLAEKEDLERQLALATPEVDDISETPSYYY